MIEQYIDTLLKFNYHDIVQADIDCGQAYSYIEYPDWFRHEIELRTDWPHDLVEMIEAEYLYIVGRGDTPTKEELMAVVGQ